MKKSTKLILLYMGGIVLGAIIVGPLFWYFGPMADHPAAVKLGALFFCMLMAFWHFMTHRTPDKTQLDFKNF